MESSIAGKCISKPAFADLNYDGLKELVVLDDAGYLRIFDYQMLCLYSNDIIENSEFTIQSYSIDDVSDDGMLDIVALLKFDDTHWMIKAFIMHDNFQFDVVDHVIEGSTVLSKNLAIGNVDLSTCYEILYITSTIDGENINVDIHKLSLISNRATGFTHCGGTIEILPVSSTRDIRVTDMILNKPHPDDNIEKKSYIYYARSYYTEGDTGIETRINIGYYRLFCIDFWDEVPVIEWDHDYYQDNAHAQDPSGYASNHYMDAMNIIAGDFITNHSGNEIITATTDEIVDAETGDFICFSIPYEVSDYSGGYDHWLQKFQPSVILDYDEDYAKELFLYRRNLITCYDENQVEDLSYHYILPDTVLSMVSGRGRDSRLYDLYALGYEYDSNISNVYFIPLAYPNQDIQYEWRQFTNNGRKTCEFYQPVPSKVSNNLTVWNNVEIDRPQTDIDTQANLSINAGVTIRMNKDAKIMNYGVLYALGSADTLLVEFAGLCNNDIRDYWGGVISLNDSELNANYLYLKNATTGISFFDTGDYEFTNSRFRSNTYSIEAYNTNIDMGFDRISDSDFGLVGIHDTRVNMGSYQTNFQGNNVIVNNTIGINDIESDFYPEQGQNDFDNLSLNIRTENVGDILVKAQNNWWGSPVDSVFVQKFNIPADICYTNWCTAPNVNNNRAKAITDYQLAEDYRINGNWAQAIPYYQIVYFDTLLTSEDFLSVTGMLYCYKNLGILPVFKDWIECELDSLQFPALEQHLRNTLALTNRSTGNYQEAINYYEGILANNPSYNDSCCAVIDLGFTWLESNYNIRSRYTVYKPKSMPSHIETAMYLINSMVLNQPVTNESETPIIPVLYQNYPNPFSYMTTFDFRIPFKSKLELSVYNIKGQKVTTIASDSFEKGTHHLIWNGKDSNNKSVASGVYFYRLKTQGKSITKKCLLLK